MSIQEQALTSDHPTDNVIQTLDNRALTGVHGTGLGDYFLPIGIYQVNGSGPYYDCANYNLPGGFTIEPSVGSDVYVNSDYRYGFFTSVGTPTVNDLAKLAALGIQGKTYNDNFYFFTGEKSYFSDRSYMKIAVQNEFTRTASSSEIRTIAHNLGYVPLANVWIKDNKYGANTLRRLIGIFDNTASGEGVRIDENNIYISTLAYVPSIDITVYYRIYYEN